MKRHFIKKPVLASKKITANYSPDLLDELIQDYSSYDMMTLDEIWEEVFHRYRDGDLANDVVEGIERQQYLDDEEY